MEVLGVIGIAISLVAIMYFITKGFNGIFAAIVATIIVIVTNQMPFFEYLVGSEESFVTGLGNFIVQNYAIFLLGSILAKYMEASGATISIANKVLDWVGKDNPYSVMVAIYIIAAILTYGGISMFVVVFAIIPIARPLFEKLDIAWNLVAIPAFGGMATFTMSMLPGTPAMPNVIPSTALGTPLTSSPVIGIVTSIVAIIFVLGYMKFELNRSIARGEKYSDFAPSNVVAQTTEDKALPSVGLSFVPIVALLAIIIAFSSTAYIVVIALAVAVILSAVLMHKYIPSQKTVINNGIVGSFGTIMVTGNTIAYGGILTAAPGFQVILDLIMDTPLSPLISLSIATIVVSFFTGSGVGTAGIAVQNFAPMYLEMGIDATLIHRIISISSSVFGIMPHTGLSITFNEVANLSLKQNFKYQFVTVNVTHMIVLVVALIMASFMY
ncbi:GntP family permease [Fundicoccus culcitae]|uniref:GntP family permease n=1 Tax=Fundicoccus culcitae TaxID=2969821 RepID=A0ABY5P733_9LACT|nr:GntP family permease [Fundicoccus culcitae]UUX34213.1 GntP family permease [Fundicoccus culcitae]